MTTAVLPAKVPSFRTALIGFTASTATMIATMLLIAGLNA
jgi:hypothetical protein